MYVLQLDPYKLIRSLLLFNLGHDKLSDQVDMFFVPAHQFLTCVRLSSTYIAASDASSWCLTISSHPPCGTGKRDIHLRAERPIGIPQLIQFVRMFILILAHFLIFRLIRIEHERSSMISPHSDQKGASSHSNLICVPDKLVGFPVLISLGILVLPFRSWFGRLFVMVDSIDFE
jgi:hypothetical protein